VAALTISRPSARVPLAERGGAGRGLIDLVTGCYPAFLFGGAIGRQLPVFHFHDVTREWLEPRVRYLIENEYRTVTCDEIAAFVRRGVSPGPRAVALTFDDAWASVWSVAMPLLKAYGLTAIVFAIPGRIRDAEQVRRVVSAANPSLNSRPESTTDSPFVTWPELRALHESGVFDIQSHTRSHSMIFAGDRVVDFVTPGFALEPLLNRPVTSDDGSLHVVEAEAFGTPLYVRRSRMSDARRFFPNESAAEACRNHVAQHGGLLFFDRPAWRGELNRIVSGGGRWERDEARAAAIRVELADGRALLNDRLRTAGVRHVALPWGIAGELTRRALADTGHDLAFAERPVRRHIVRAGDDPHQLMRLNGKFLMCLPGRGRQWFFTTVRPA
jgi:hypothetical protein